MIRGLGTSIQSFATNDVVLPPQECRNRLIHIWPPAFAQRNQGNSMGEKTVLATVVLGK